MTETKFSNLVNEFNSKRMKLNIVLIIQAPVIFIILWKVSHISLPLSPLLLMSLMMLLWFYGVYLMMNLFIADVKMICSSMSDDISTKHPNSEGELPNWQYFSRKLWIFSRNSLIATLPLASVLFATSSKIVAAAVVVVGIVVNYFYNLYIVNKAAQQIIKYYADKYDFSNSKFQSISLKRILLLTATIGIVFLTLLIYFLELPVFYYIGYYFVFNVLLMVSQLVLSQVSIFQKNLAIIDSLKSQSQRE